MDEKKFGIWFPVNDGGWRIKRTVTLPDGKRSLERLDRKTYTHIPKTYEDLLRHCDRLNYGTSMKRQRQVEIESAFLPSEILSGFHSELQAAIADKNYVKYLFEKSFKEYFLGYFVNRLKMPNPAEWPKRQVDWGLALLGKKSSVFDEKLSARTIQLTIQTANRFMKYLHQQMPSVYPLIKLTPVSKPVLKLYKAERPSPLVGRFIPHQDWRKIRRKLPKEIRAVICLMYYYGLRRSEALGFQSTDSTRKTYLLISTQLKSNPSEGPVYTPLKGRDVRKTPHWFCRPKIAYGWINESLNCKMHPDSLSEKFDEVMRDMGMNYHLHDFRRTFITKALRRKKPRDVQLAVGHTDLRTTMAYAQDDRQLEDDIFIPEAS